MTSATENPIGASPVQYSGGTPYPAAASQSRWFMGRGMSREETCDPENLARILVGVCVDLSGVQGLIEPSMLRQLRAAARAVRQVIGGQAVAIPEGLLALMGDHQPGEVQDGFAVVAVTDADAWNWPLSRLRWLLAGQACETLLALGDEHPSRPALLDAIDRLDARLRHVASRHQRAA